MKKENLDRLERDKQRLIACDFVRAVCTIGIVIYHFSCHLLNSTFLPLYSFKNGDWGSVFVTVFFIISGAMLYYNNREIISLKQFYYKRWKTIYPMFYIAFISFFLKNILTSKQLFYNGNPKSIILSILGIDGYFLYRYDNYYILGEWFLGAIIILYILFPLILWCFNKSDKITTIIVLLLYLWQINTNWFIIDNFRNIFSCICSFEIGMLIIKHHNWLKNLKLVIISFLGAFIIYTMKLPINSNIAIHLMGIFLFFILFYLGEIVMKISYLNNFILEISRISYAIFLLHHIILAKILLIYNPNNYINILLLLIFIIILVIIVSKILYLITNLVLKSKIYLIFEKKIKDNE